MSRVSADNDHQEVDSMLPWLLHMEWHDVLFLHWPVPVDSIDPHIPDRLTIETFGGTAWLGIVPFLMRDIRPRWLPPVSCFSNFPELNIRTYVNDGSVSGVWFHSLDASSWISVQIARGCYSLNYYHADMKVERNDDFIHFRSKRKSHESGDFLFKASYEPVQTETNSSDQESLEKFLTERYYLFSSDDNGNIYRGAIEHDPWTLSDVDIQIEEVSIQGHPSPATGSPVSSLYASNETVHAWLPHKISQ